MVRSLRELYQDREGTRDIPLVGLGGSVRCIFISLVRHGLVSLMTREAVQHVVSPGRAGLLRRTLKKTERPLLKLGQQPPRNADLDHFHRACIG